jgi:branched-chain amino acid transport system ATP-binding protein
MPKLVSAERLTAGFGASIVLEDVSFEVDAGDSLALLGRNGVDKTTLLLTLMGLTRLKSGSLAWEGAVSTSIFRNSKSASSIWAINFPAVSSRCWPSVGR